MTEEELILSVMDVIRGTVNNFCKSWWGLDKEELYLECMVPALDGIRRFDPSRGVPLRNFIGMKVKHYLIQVLRHPPGYLRFKAPRSEETIPEREAREDRFQQIRLEVSEQANIAINVALALAVDSNDGPHRRNGWNRIGKFLRKELKWEREVIREVVEEIREALA